MKAIVLMLLLFLTNRASALDRLSALWMLESGGNDHMIGKVGEVSRYQVRPAVWRSVTHSRQFTEPQVARLVAVAVMNKRISHFTAKFGRRPTNFEYYGLWNAPGEVMSQHISPVVARRCERFCNLCKLTPSMHQLARR